MHKTKSEAEFKKGVIDLWKKKKIFDYIFCIETEETVKGFPDVMVKLKDMEVYKFFEFKVSDDKGRIKFTMAQPGFYVRHTRMDIQVLALDNRHSEHDEMIMFPVSKLFERDSPFEMNGNREVFL